ncbi:MAG: hypothetical protein V6Z89_05620 [Desulfobacter sp.]
MDDPNFIYRQLPKLVDSSFVDFQSDSVVSKRIVNGILGQFRAKIALETSKYWVKCTHPDIYQIQMAARNDGGLTGRYQWLRLWEICKIFRKWDIKSVLEFGSGASSSMFAKLLDSKQNFISIDQSRFWAERTRKIVGPYANKINLLQYDRILEFFDGESCTRYDLPERVYSRQFDLVYIDGPTANLIDQDNASKVKILDKKGTMPNIDIEYMLNHGVWPKLIVVDGRRATVRRLLKRLRGKYEVCMKYAYEHPFQRSGRFFYHSIFVKID